MTRSYTYNGTIDLSYEAWEKWIIDSLAICSLLGYEANYYLVGVKNKIGGKASPIGGILRKMKNIAAKKETISCACLMVLPEDFISACFDYVICLSRNANYVTLIVNQDYRMSVDENLINNLLQKHITADCGEIYEMDISDCPEFYAGKANPKNSFKSLKIIKSLVG